MGCGATKQPQCDVLVAEYHDISTVQDYNDNNEVPIPSNTSESEEFFIFGDFMVPHSPVELSSPKLPCHSRRRWRLKRGDIDLAIQCDGSTFEFGDFCVHLPELRSEVFGKMEMANISSYEIYSLIGHSTKIKSLFVIPHRGLYISCGVGDSSFTLSSIYDGKPIRYFEGHDDIVYCVSASPIDGRHILSCSRDCSMVLWDIATGHQIRSFDHHNTVICCTFSPDGQCAVSGCQDQICRVWELSSGIEMTSFHEHEGVITSLCYSPDGIKVASASSDMSVKVWNSYNGTCLYAMSEHNYIITNCAFSVDGHSILSNDLLSYIIWEPSSGEVIKKIYCNQNETLSKETMHKIRWITSAWCPPPFSCYIVVACSDSTLRIINSLTNEEILNHPFKSPILVISGAQSQPNEAILTLGDTFGNVFVLRLSALIKDNKGKKKN